MHILWQQGQEGAFSAKVPEEVLQGEREIRHGDHLVGQRGPHLGPGHMEGPPFPLSFSSSSSSVISLPSRLLPLPPTLRRLQLQLLLQQGRVSSLRATLETRAL